VAETRTTNPGAIAKATPTSTALVAGEMPDWLKGTIEKYVNNPHFDLLLPSIPVGGSLHPWYKPTASLVQLSANPDDGDVWKAGKKNDQDVYALSKAGLMKIADAAGISFAPSVRMDDRSNPDYCEIQASGWMLNSMGQRIEKSAIKAFYMPDVEAEAMRTKARWEKTATEAQLKQLVAGEMAQFRKHLVRRVDTGAKTAVVRELLAVSGNLTAAKIAKPKVCLRFDFVGDMGDPDVKRFMLEQATGARRDLYGPERPSKRDLGEAEEVIDSVVDDETLETRKRASEGGGQPDGRVREVAPSGSPEPAADPLTLPLSGEPDYLTLVAEGCRALGLTSEAKNALAMRHHGDLRAMYLELNAQANKDAQ
jgi:hypothetical protein